MAVRIWGFVLFIVAELGRINCAETISFCPVGTVRNSFLAVRDVSCPIDWDVSLDSKDGVGVVEGNEVSLQKALSMVNKHVYVALLFYASWCPFSASFRPKLFMLSSLYPSIPHIAIEESVIRPSILSKYGVHGFPTLFLLNSTMRMQYHGPRTFGSLVAFYDDITGFTSVPLESTSLQKIIRSSDSKAQYSNEPESCPFSWFRSPENLLCQETYLALATSFLLLRLLYFMFPSLSAIAQLAWTRYVRNITLRSLLEHPRAYLNRALHLLNYLKERGKRSNLQEGALNAKAWASKSWASVSFEETSKGLE